MNIPEEAIQAAAEALAELEPGEDWPSNTDLGGHAVLGTRDDEFKWAMEQDAERALTAALPHIRAQIAAEIRAESEAANWAKTFRNGLEHAAQTVEEGTTK